MGFENERLKLSSDLDLYFARARACGVAVARARAILAEEVNKARSRPDCSIAEAIRIASKRMTGEGTA